MAINTQHANFFRSSTLDSYKPQLKLTQPFVVQMLNLSLTKTKF